MIESNLWNWLKKAEGHLGPGLLHMTRIENSASAGFSDVEGYLYGRGAFWFELKIFEYPKKASTPITFHNMRPAQSTWLKARWNAGGPAFILASTDDTRYLIPGHYGRELKQGVSQFDFEHNMSIHQYSRRNTQLDIIYDALAWRAIR